MMADLMPKKNYDLTEITRLLLEMRENCIPKAGDAYEDPNRAEKYDALNAAIDLINNPSLLTRWISVKDRLPEEGQHVLTYVKFPEFAGFCAWECHMTNVRICDGWVEDVTTSRGVITHWMPLPELPKEEA